VVGGAEPEAGAADMAGYQWEGDVVKNRLQYLTGFRDCVGNSSLFFWCEGARVSSTKFSTKFSGRFSHVHGATMDGS
jgi:hypothetical protein